MREQVTKGAMGLAAITEVDHVQARYDYGPAFRDPFGNHLRMGTPTAFSAS